MDPSLERYVAKAYSLLTGYWFIADAEFDFLTLGEDEVQIVGRAQLIDGSMIYIREVTLSQKGILTKADYSFQFRDEEDEGFFRYDSASHGRPKPYHHKHVKGKPPTKVKHPPTLLEFFKEIENVITGEM